jgi:hypothetical protein
MFFGNLLLEQQAGVHTQNKSIERSVPAKNDLHIGMGQDLQSEAGTRLMIRTFIVSPGF